MCGVSYVLRMFGITAGYHRYFAHRAYKTSRAFQFSLALVGTSATQKGPLWWAAAHRRSITAIPILRSMFIARPARLWYSHLGWWRGDEHVATDWAAIPDFTKYPELVFLDRWHVIGVALNIVVAYALRGFDGLLWGYVVSTFLVLHATFAINSLAHVVGSRRYETSDTSRNNAWLAVLTMGEGWHNNHHHYMSSANQGFFWWEVDVSYYVLKALSWVGLVWTFAGHPSRLRRRIAPRADLPAARATSPAQ